MEMKEEACKDFRSWEEQIYWNHFQCLHFSQVLHAGFDRQLAIPEHFTRNLRRKLPSTLILRSPCGTEWQVGLTTTENTIFFTLGWQEFAKDYSLQENDILVFKYNGESCFDVLAFYGQSLCENVSSYFLRKCSRRRPVAECHFKRRGGESSGKAVGASSGDGVGCPLPKKPEKGNVSTKLPRQKFNSRIVNTKVRRKIKFEKPISAANSERNKEIHACAEDIKTKPEVEYPCSSASGRRSITEGDKERVLQLAQAALSPEGFIAVMKPTHVSRKFYLNVPWTWLTKHLSCRKKQVVILRINENTWRAQAAMYRRKDKQSRGGLGGGWRKFVSDNNLREFDVCMFEPNSQLNNSSVIDVTIFRVV